MLPSPVHERDGTLWGGEPETVGVRLDPAEQQIAIVEAGIRWDSQVPLIVAQPFAARPFSAPATEVARLVIAAHAKRLSRYRWCPRCQKQALPEQMNVRSVCDGCASKHFGVVF